MMNAICVSSFNTGEFHGHDVKYSPHASNLLACASSENYGIAGRGRLYILDIGSEPVKIFDIFDWPEGLFDVTWSECHDQILATSCADGAIRLWNYTQHRGPVSVYKIHEKEVYSIDWNPKNAYPYIVSASWDHTVKLWNPFAEKEIASFLEHNDQVYEAVWNANHPEIFASVSGDTTARIWDVRTSVRTVAYSHHSSEALCCDWSKICDILAVGTCDGKIYGWDIRNMKHPAFHLLKHDYAIRRLKFNPFRPGYLTSVSYDYTTRIWQWDIPQPVQILKDHTEFVFGLDYSPLRPGQMCDCAWDSRINIYKEVS